MEDNYKSDFFKELSELVKGSEIVIDRPKGSAHPRYPDYIYPLDYGYIEGTSSQDGDGIDVWCGSENRKDIFGILVIFDPVKKDSEIKVLLGCSGQEAEQALNCSNRGSMTAFLVKFNKEEK
jgi:inorganic pyrophosphatase